MDGEVIEPRKDISGISHFLSYDTFTPIWNPGLVIPILWVKYSTNAYSSIKTSFWRIDLPFIHRKFIHDPTTFIHDKYNWSYTNEINSTLICTTRPYVFLLASAAPNFNDTYTISMGNKIWVTLCFSTTNISHLHITFVYIAKQKAQLWLQVQLNRPWQGGSKL